MSNIMIGISAHNEENNIGNLIEDILLQKKDIELNLESDNSKLEKVLIISDASSDKTDSIVSSYGQKSDLIKLIRRDKRYGKTSALNLIFNEAKKYDILILLDADIRLDKNCLKYLIKDIKDIGKENGNICMIGGNPIPFDINDPFLIGEQVSYFSWKLLNEIKTKCDENLYHSHGRILALTKKLFQEINIPDTVIADDQYLYLYCLKNGMRFKYEDMARVLFKLPADLGDHLKQSMRFTESIKQNNIIFGEDFIKENMKIKNKLIFVNTYLRNPYKGSLWLLAYIFGKFLYKPRISTSWDISKTTK